MGIPCLTVRENTERPITITQGTNQLCDMEHLKEKIDAVLRDRTRNRKEIELWDGKTAERIMEILRNIDDI